MATAVYLKLRNGRRIRFGRARDAVAAAKVKIGVEVRDGMTLSVANSDGDLEDVSRINVEGVELASDSTLARGAETVGR